MGTGWHSGTPPSSIRASSKSRMFEPNKSKCTHRASSVFVMYDELCQMYNSFETVLNMRLFLRGIFVGQAMQVEKNYLGRQFIVARIGKLKVGYKAPDGAYGTMLAPP